MASTMQVGEIWKATIATYLGGQSGLNNIHFAVVGFAGTGGTDSQLALAIDAAIAPDYKAAMNNQATYYGVKVVRYWPKPVAIPQISTSTTGIGTAGTTPMPTAVSGIIRWRTAIIGKHGVGRIYVPFPATTAVTTPAPQPNSAYIGLLVAIAAGIDGIGVIGTPPNTSTVDLVVTGKPAVPPATQIYYPVTAYNGGSLWGTQHRRGDYGRPNPVPPLTP